MVSFDGVRRTGRGTLGENEFGLERSIWGHSLELTEDEAAELAALERIREYEERLYDKYRRAAGLPWLPVAPDSNPPAAGPPRDEARMQWWLPVAPDSNPLAGTW